MSLGRGEDTAERAASEQQHQAEQDQDTAAQAVHRRYDPLRGAWVLISPHRSRRPWLGQHATVASSRTDYDPDCYLCPSNRRAGGQQNPAYKSTFVFDNDFPALLPSSLVISASSSSSSSQSSSSQSSSSSSSTPVDVLASRLLQCEPESGVCRVLCFHPRHDLSLPELSSDELFQVVQAWITEYRELSRDPQLSYVQIFENKGALMGCSNPHPHCQLWATRTLPALVSQELSALRAYRVAHDGCCLLCDYVRLELQLCARVVCQNDHFVILVPYWAYWPFETLLLSKRHVGSLLDLDEVEQHALANIIHQVTVLYDNLFRVSFPYSMGFHQEPCGSGSSSSSDTPIPCPEAHLHAHYYPPLLRSASVQKFMAGYELLASPQRDITAEESAKRLRELPKTHFSMEKEGHKAEQSSRGERERESKH